MVNVGGEKMSKSLGNFTTIRALLESGVSPMTLRLFVLQAHYRKPLDFTGEALAAAATGWKGLEAALALGERHGPALGWGATPPGAGSGGVAQPEASKELTHARGRFAAAMDDDLNTSAALAVLFELARPLRALANRLERGETEAAAAGEAAELEPRWRLLRELAGVLGLEAEASAATAETAPAGADGAAIRQRIEERRAAKAARDFATADRIRAELAAQGIELIDRPGGVTDWVRG
jgi:cysteinyl-tRNA synthetase